jgi:predicted short-subunit dehydrogenase-like oxidoreductase (DUF2520 family)
VPQNILDLSVCIAGPGRAATAFARSWREAGGRIEHVLSRDQAGAERVVALLKVGQPRTAGSGRFACDLLILGVPDDSLGTVAARIAPEVSCRLAFHLSGAAAAEEIGILRRSGASVGSLHPLRAFSGEPSENWRGAFVAIEGDERACCAGEQIVRAFGAAGRRLAAESKALYHAAATLAAGGTLALVSRATRVWASIGLPEDEARAALADLAARAAATATHRPFEDAFTGPLARRDLNTVRVHRAALATRPELLRLYDLLARETLERTPGRGKEDEILSLLDGRNESSP